MARKWPVDGDDSDRLPEGIVLQGYDSETMTYFYRSNIDGKRYRTRPGQKYGELIPITSDATSSEPARPVLVRDSLGTQHRATPYRLKSRAATFNDVFASRKSWDNESRTVVEDDDEDDDWYSFDASGEKEPFNVGITPRSRSFTAPLVGSASRTPGSQASGVAKKVGKLARMVSKRIASRPSSSSRAAAAEGDGERALSYDPHRPVVRRGRAATTFEQLLVETPKKDERPIKNHYSMRQKRTTTW
ncbi:hypothetical protein QBC43DRAFT_325534 [Cladorrhinum sp. PSN259]|nr:hypothetical protein QBC43DRAFT_325534 [Cladorrhinum sp. PSN259]